MVTQLLETLPMQSEYLPEELKERYRLSPKLGDVPLSVWVWLLHPKQLSES